MSLQNFRAYRANAARPQRHLFDIAVAALAGAGLGAAAYEYVAWLPIARADETGLAWLGPWLAAAYAPFFLAALVCTLVGIARDRHSQLVAGRAFLLAAVLGVPWLVMVLVLTVSG
jgi:hypothetical protein